MPDKDLSVTIGPFIGMSDTPSYGAQDATRARYLMNVYGPASAVGGDLISRPAYNQVSFAAYAGSGTISATSPSATVTGVGTFFTTQVSVGDLLSVGASSGIVTSIASDTSLAVHTAVTFSGAYTITPAGIVAGKILGCWQHTLTTGAHHRLLLVSTTSVLQSGGAAGVYRFLNAANLAIKLVEWNPSATSPYQVLVDRTTTSMDGVALSTLSRLYAVTFANSFIISDGTNRPRAIDGSFVLTNLSDANYAFFGPLTVYYGSLMGIDASDQNTLRWSNVGDPTTGYGTGTSDQSWALQQTSADPLTCVIGTNQALFAFRSNSIAIITGASNSDFASSGAIDAVQSIGTNSPDSVMLAGSSVVFLDQYLRPGRVQIGYGYVPLYLRIQETLRAIGNTPSQEGFAWGRLDPTTNLIKFALRWTTGATTNTAMLVFDVNSFECFGQHVVVNSSGYAAIDHAFSGGNPQSSSPLLDANLQPVHVVASGTSTDCAFYWQSHEFVPATVSQDVLANGTLVTVQGTVQTPLMGLDPILEKAWDRVVVGIRNVGGSATGYPTVTSSYRTPYTNWTTPKDMTYSGTGKAGLVNYDGQTMKVEISSLRQQAARYIQFSFQNDVTGNPATRFTFDTVTVLGHATDDTGSRR